MRILGTTLITKGNLGFAKGISLATKGILDVIKGGGKGAITFIIRKRYNLIGNKEYVLKYFRKVF